MGFQECGEVYWRLQAADDSRLEAIVLSRSRNRISCLSGVMDDQPNTVIPQSSWRVVLYDDLGITVPVPTACELTSLVYARGPSVIVWSISWAISKIRQKIDQVAR